MHSDLPSSAFEAREEQRRLERVARYNLAAEAKFASKYRHRYYGVELERLIQSLVPPGSRVLEVGTSAGAILEAIGGPGSVGINAAPRMVELLREQHPTLDLRTADVERDELPQGPFDAIVLSDAIGMLDDIQVALERLRPLLAPGGRLFVTYYNFVWEPLLELAERVGVKTRWPDQKMTAFGFEKLRMGL